MRNRADQAVYAAERLVKDTGDKLTAADKQALEEAMEGVKKANEGTDSAAIQKALDQLTAAQHKAAESLYKQGAAAGGVSGAVPATRRAAARRRASTGSGPAAGAGGEVIDAEVVDEGKGT